MGELINLNKARKARANAAGKAQAAVNRSRHGQTKAEKARLAAEKALAAKRLDDLERDT